MPITETTLYRDRLQIVGDMLSQLLTAIPDAHTGRDGVTRILVEIQAGQLEQAFLAVQLLLEDVFIQTAGVQALHAHGEEQGLGPHEGIVATGSLRFTGPGGTYIPVGTEAAYDPGLGLDVIYFTTTQDGTIPNPGIPTAPTAVLDAAAGNLNGTYEYVVTFVTAEGEGLPSDLSDTVTATLQKADLSNIPIGGPGTIARRIYRDKNGVGVYRRVAEIANNTATTYEDNITDAAVAASALVPAVNTAERVTLEAAALMPGAEGNVATGLVTNISSAPAALTEVTNPIAFTGGSDPEDTEEFRQRLLAWVRNPQTGSPADLKGWAEDVQGVDTATVFENMNGVVATNGHVTVRITAPGGAIPSAEIVTRVQEALDEQDIANITIHVMTFTQVSTDVTVDATPSSGFTLEEISPGVADAISDYINNTPVGGPVIRAAIIDAVYGLPGVADVTVTTPATNLTTTATEKRIAGTIIVT